jgi:hypothetical protein
VGDLQDYAIGESDWHASVSARVLEPNSSDFVLFEAEELILLERIAKEINGVISPWATTQQLQRTSVLARRSR